MKENRAWSAHFRRGVRRLSRHDAAGALREFRRGVELCPPEATRELARLLYFLGLALDRSGEGALAAVSWVQARKLVRSGRLARACGRWVNDYGMRRQSSPFEDDYRAFESIQVSRYLARRPGARFRSAAERDAIRDLLRAAWRPISRLPGLALLDAARKLAFFRAAQPSLPFLVIDGVQLMDAEPLSANFRQGARLATRLTPASSCPCGSGAAFSRCCGRQKSFPSRVIGSL